MSLYIFGYGSLMHPGSLGRGLGRAVSASELGAVRVAGFRRDWGLREAVFSHVLGRQVNAAFLDLYACEGASVSGTIIPVTADEYAKLRLREKNYAEVEVSAATVGGDVTAQDTVMTSVGTAHHRAASPGSEVYVMQRYIDMIREALELLGSTAQEDFGQTTDEASVPVLGGRYTFIDPAQAARV